ncbi:MAG: hypothetical protein JRI25_27935, partial [Deltaproteobacteria bacterium]|nr:hypothetical protein [Deltaproteobacteria bacterium]
MRTTPLLLLALIACGNGEEATTDATPTDATPTEEATPTEAVTTEEGGETSAVDAALPTQLDKVSYSIGWDIGKSFVEIEPNPNTEQVKAGMDA